MKQFRVRLNAVADVRQVVVVTAKNAKDAQDKAVEEAGNNVWKYDGVNNRSIEVEGVEEA